MIQFDVHIFPNGLVQPLPSEIFCLDPKGCDEGLTGINLKSENASTKVRPNQLEMKLEPL